MEFSAKIRNLLRVLYFIKSYIDNIDWACYNEIYLGGKIQSGEK